MARFITVRVEGGEELDRKFEQLASAVETEILLEAVTAGAAPIVESMIERAPTGKTGKLKGSIRPDVVALDQEHCDVEIGPHVPQAHLVEFGHLLVAGGRIAKERRRNRFGKISHSQSGTGGRVIGHVPAHPFIRPAWDEHKDEAVGIIADKIRKAVEAAAT